MIGAKAALHRFGLGPKAGDGAQDTVTDPRSTFETELLTPGAAEIAGLPSTLEIGAELARDRADQQFYQETFRIEIEARLARWRAAEPGCVERLVMFWMNHFAIEAQSGGLERALVGAFERDALRPFVLGRFRDMLGAATKHPAMLSYLDNARSVGPNSPIGRRRDLGLNENHARELLELHTVGVNGGYTQADVTALARVLTGWTFAANQNERVPTGSFVFRQEAHEPGSQTVMGTSYSDDGIGQGEAVLDTLARHPATARHLASKLVRHFVADDPPADLVARLADVFAASDGDLAAVSLALISDDAAYAQPTKLKTPQEYVFSAMRALELELPMQSVLQGLGSLGQPIWQPPSPAGFSDDSATWLAPDAMTNRLDVAELMAAEMRLDIRPDDLVDRILGSEVSDETVAAILGAASEPQAVALLLMSPEFQRR